MSIDSYPAGALMVIVSCLIAVSGLLAARKFLDIKRLKEGHEVGGSLFQVAGTLYAVLLGLVIVDAMGKFQEARSITEQEANSVADVFVLAQTLPEDRRTHIRQMCVDYVDQVVNVEWKDMTQAQVCLRARHLAVGMMREIMTFEPQTENQKAIYPQLVSEATQVWDNRRARTNIATNGVPSVEWISLLVGGVITVVFTYFFGLESLRNQIIMTSMITCLISLNLFMFLLFGYPFSGDLCVRPDAFVLDQQIFQQRVFEDTGAKPAS